MSRVHALRDGVLQASQRFASLATPIRVLLDIGAWIAAVALAVFLRFDLSFAEAPQDWALRTVPLLGGLQVLFGTAIGLYRRRWRYGSFDEVAGVALAAVLTTGTMYGLNHWYFETRPIPQSAVLVGGVIGLMLMAAFRYLWRLLLETVRRPDARTAERLLIFGAGEGGIQIVTSLLRSRDSPYLPVGFIDDDPAKQRLSIKGVPVLGRESDIGDAVKKTGATSLLFAIPSADSHRLSELRGVAEQHGLSLKVLPSVTELFGDEVSEGHIRDVTEEDLLGRGVVETDLASIASYVDGKRVLVTGAGGSIGSELCRQLRAFNPSELMLLDRDESALHQTQLSMTGRALLDSSDTVLADIRDADRLEEVFASRKPEVVFHAAALKHLPLLERYPSEAYKSNVLGTRNVLEAARRHQVEVFVNVSTDKAANPISVLGFSKRVAERITASFGAADGSARYISVRFGNVLGSRGSVLTIFREQIRRGGPITVTDANVTRFFMTIAEAVQLVIQAGAIGRSGEVLVLDMGVPVSILNVARQLVRESGRDIEIQITGLRPGEKMQEELFGAGERDIRPAHRLISHAVVPPLDPSVLGPARTDDLARMIGWCSHTDTSEPASIQ